MNVVWKKAKKPGVCLVCEKKYKAGETLVLTDSGELIHFPCPEEKPKSFRGKGHLWKKDQNRIFG